MPFAENDLIYGAADKGCDPRLPLGSLDFRGEYGVLKFGPASRVRSRTSTDTSTVLSTPVRILRQVRRDCAIEQVIPTP